MLESLVRGALKQRLVVCVIAVMLLFFGLHAATKLSVDAFPDVTNVQVQIATEAPGRSPEEVERFATVPIEVAMTGLPGLTELRSLNKPGLSLISWSRSRLPAYAIPITTPCRPPTPRASSRPSGATKAPASWSTSGRA